MTYPPQPDAPESPEPSQVVPQPPKRKRTGLIIGAAVGGALVLVAAAVAITLVLTLGGRSTASKAIRINGLLRLNDLVSSMSTNANCSGTGGYDDIHGGTQVTITDEAGTVIGLAQLGDGSRVGGTCVFMFTVNSVPAGKSFYGVTVSHRGTIRYTEAQLKDPVELTLGN